MLNIVNELFHLITNPVCHILFPHFADEETEAREPAQACEQHSSQELPQFQLSGRESIQDDKD